MKKSGKSSLSSNKVARVRSCFLFVCLAVLALLNACASVTTVSTSEQKAAADIIQTLRKSQSEMNSFAGKGGINIQTADNQHYFQMMVAVQRPKSLRLQAFDFLGRPAMILIINEDELSYLDYGKSILYKGPATYENINKFLPLGLKVDDVITLLSGGQPLSAYRGIDVKKTQQLGQEVWQVTLLRTEKDLAETIWVRPDDLRIDRVEVGPRESRPTYSLDYAKYKQIVNDGRQTPHFIKASDLKSGTQLTITYDEVKVNPELPETLFILKPPAGVRVESIPETTDQGV